MSISPSQISLWRDCKRKFAFTYLSGLPRPPETKAQRIGIALHAKAERFIQTGQIDYSSQTPEEVEAARLLPAILDYLPKGAQAEQKVKVTIDGVDFGGRFDWFTGTEIGDLKTTSSLRWAKTEEELSINPQALIYSAAVNRDASCRWVYVQTKGAPHVREVRFKPDFAAMPGLVHDAKDIVQAWDKKGDPNNYPPTLSACDAYGGCPFKAHCKVDSGQRLAMLMGIKGPQGPTETTDKKDPPDMSTSFDDLMKSIGATAPQPTMAINPPPMQAVTRTEELPAVLDPVKALTEEAEKNGEYEAAKPKRKRRTKAEMEMAKIVPGTSTDLSEVAAIVGTVACDPQPKTDPAPAQDTAGAAEPKAIGTLYIGCQPDHSCENAAYVFNAANWEVSEAAGLTDYRQAEYNKLQGFFVAAVVSKVKTIRPEHLFVDTRWAETNACLATLIAMADRVVRAL